MFDEFDFNTEEIIRDKFGPSCRFKGGNGYSSPPRPQLSQMGKWGQKRIYADIERALAGGGLGPSGGLQKLRAGYARAYPQAERGLESQLKRLVPKEDIGVQRYARGMLSRAYAGDIEALKWRDIETKYNEQQEALGMGLDALSAEKGMATSITQLLNRQREIDLANQARFGTFGTQLGRGIGQMAGWMAPGGADSGHFLSPATGGIQLGTGRNIPVQQRYAQGMAGW